LSAIFEVTVKFCLSGTADAVRYKSNYPQFWLYNYFFCFLYNNPQRYHYTSKAAVIKLTCRVTDVLQTAGAGVIRL
jgi:hypothetical protein